MGKKKNDSQQKNKEPWSRKFSEEENHKSTVHTRSARKAKKDEVAPLYKVLLFLFLALLLIPFATIYWNERTKGAPDPKTPEQVMVTKKGTSSVAGKETKESDQSKENAKVSSEEKPQKKKEESISEEKPQKKKDEPSVEATEPEIPISPEETVEPESAETAPVQPPAPVEEADEDNKEYNNSYTVQAGDNLYRIALNHGMDLEVLKSINGLTSDVAEIGKVLKVK